MYYTRLSACITVGGNGLILREVQVLELNDVWGNEFDQLAFNGFMATIAQDYKG